MYMLGIIIIYYHSANIHTIITFNTESREKKRLNLALRIDVMLFAATKQSHYQCRLSSLMLP